MKDGSDTRTGGEALVECLVAQGVRAIFGVPGESYLPVLDALHDEARIRLVPNRQEGGAAFAATAWGRLTGEPGIAFVTRGPGACNAAIGVHSARQDSAPMILFVGQIETAMREREAFQEIDYRAMFGTVAKWATEIETPERIPEIVARAFAVAQTGRPGPVVVGLPEDVLFGPCAARPGPRVRVPRAAPAECDIEELAGLMAKAERPVVIVGGGGWSQAARDDLRAFAEGNHLPVLTAFRFQDLMDSDSPAYVGDAGLGKLDYVKRLIGEADLILALGLRFGENTTDGYALFGLPKMEAVLIHVHASDGELNKIYTADLPIHASPDHLMAALRDLRIDGAARWAGRTAEARRGFLACSDLPEPPGPLDMRAVMRHLGNVLPEDAIVTNGAGNFAIWPNKHFPFRARQRLVAPQSGAMGYGLPAGIAARVACPERCVVSFAGDGDLQMVIQELATARQARACPILIVVNNSSYGTIRMHQEKHYPGRVSFTDLENPDFVAIARACGLAAERVARTADFAPAFDATVAAGAGGVIELVLPVEAISPRTTITAIRAAAQGE
jgi:acetolactate synthase I/II/III large subunit